MMESSSLNHSMMH